MSLLRNLKHANIVTLHDLVHTERSLTLVFEYLVSARGWGGLARPAPRGPSQGWLGTQARGVPLAGWALPTGGLLARDRSAWG